MKVKVAKWGNSLGVRLPRTAVDSIGVIAGTELDLTVERGGLRLSTPILTSAELLDQMIAEMKRLGPGHEPPAVDWGPDRGSEIIRDEYSSGTVKKGGPSKSSQKSKRARRTDAPSRLR